MRKILLTFLLIFGFTTSVFCEQWNWYKEYGTDSEINSANLNGNFRNGMTIVNGGLDNLNSKDDFRFIEIVTTLPLVGEEGRTVYLTTEDVLYLDDGSNWWGTPTYQGTPAHGEVIYFDGTNWKRLGVGSVGNTLKSGGAGANVSWAALNLASGANYVSGILPTANGGTGNISGNPSGTAGGSLTGTYPNPTIAADTIPKVVFAWSGNESYAANNYGMNISTTENLDVSGTDSAGFVNFVNHQITYRTFLRFKFKKVKGIDTVTIYARIWSSSATSGYNAVLNVDIDGQNADVQSANGVIAPAWATADDVNVSGLTDGTVYDGIIQLKHTINTVDAYCSAVTLIGS